jgi:methenyltetrahydromethanopterin cyclohydrolase
LGYELGKIDAGYGVAPLPPPGKDDLTSLGRTNDAILYGCRVELWLRDDDDRLADVAPRIPASASPAYGTPFLDIFKSANYDFYAIDKLLFAPAEIVLHNRTTGRSFAAGRLAPEVLRRSWA